MTHKKRKKSKEGAADGSGWPWVHEAGHALACYLARCQFTKVSALADIDTYRDDEEDGDCVSLGRLWLTLRFDEDGLLRRSRNFMEKRVMILLAGAAAVEIVTSESQSDEVAQTSDGREALKYIG